MRAKLVWIGCGRKRGNSPDVNFGQKLFIEPSRARTSSASGYAFGKTLIRFGKPELSTEMQRPC
ncbi:hypothetical protein PCAR4_150129 [Paraburkholderia caribensis]|nr:hypothetical protein PCAR4_150129 [Paraburkholderia caribensis]